LLPVHALFDLLIVALAGGLGLEAAVWDAGWAAALAATLVMTHPRLVRDQ
jgi:hypothetical protein